MEDNKLVYKIIVVGDLGVGKTSIIKRYVHEVFSSHYKSTIGVDFSLKTNIKLDEHRTISYQLWDIAGQERFGNMTRIYYKEATVVFVVFDVTRESTIQSIAKWKNDVDAKVTLPNGKPLFSFLVANKVDISDVPSETLEQIKKIGIEYGFNGVCKTSAKEGYGIEELFNEVTAILRNYELGHQEPETIKIIERPVEKSSCC